MSYVLKIKQPERPYGRAPSYLPPVYFSLLRTMYCFDRCFFTFWVVVSFEEVCEREGGTMEKRLDAEKEQGIG